MHKVLHSKVHTCSPVLAKMDQTSWFPRLVESCVLSDPFMKQLLCCPSKILSLPQDMDVMEYALMPSPLCHAGILVFTYLGSAAADLPSIIRGEVGPSRGWQIAIIVVSVLATVAALLLLTWYAKKEIERKLAEQQQGSDQENLSEGLLRSDDLETGRHVVDKKGYSYVRTRVEE
jgi:hypothetical protein